ncbi:MAG: hypothetical protein ACYDH5_20135 [Acidimicrobiales bacterium]
MFWIVDPTPDGGVMVWHNGATGGHSAFLALFPGAQQAVAGLANTSRASDLERIALALARSLHTGQARHVGDITTDG